MTLKNLQFPFKLLLVLALLNIGCSQDSDIFSPDSSTEEGNSNGNENENGNGNGNENNVEIEEGSFYAVYFAQSHILSPESEFFRLVSNRDALLKVNILTNEQKTLDSVTVELSLNSEKNTITLNPPTGDLEPFDAEAGLLAHSFDDSFTAVIPKEWVQPGLKVSITGGSQRMKLNDLNIGAPSKIIMNMFDVHYFRSSPGDYTAGWKEEMQEKIPTSNIELNRVPNIIFEELTIPPRSDVNAIAARVSTKQEYKDITGVNFDGEQAAALQWSHALSTAAGFKRNGKDALYYINIYGVFAGGQAGGFAGVGNGNSLGILHHELGHAYSLAHLNNERGYPYQNEMFGFPPPDSHLGFHIGPSWGFDRAKMKFLSPIVQENSVGGTAGTFKKDPMMGGGVGDQETDFLMRHFSQFSKRKMQNYLENTIVVWNEELNNYAKWDETTGDYSAIVENNGVQYPVQRNVEIISVMAGVSTTTPQANIVYKPIGPYIGGLIDIFDPQNESDKTRADEIYCPSGGCDVTLKVTQGGEIKYMMLPLELNPDNDNPTHRSSYQTKAVNLPASDGMVTKIELLATPDVEKNGLPSNPEVLRVWNN